ncbi:MAG TPA: histidine kinase dimerization/phospho-acceptor domain-containing protein [Chloroflexota bacterium]|jgi:signal transduction histidine kinase
MLLLESEEGARPENPPVDLGRLVGPLFHHSRDALVIVDAGSGRVVLRNPSAERIFGRAAEEPGPPPLDALLPDLLAVRVPGTRLRVGRGVRNGTSGIPQGDLGVRDGLSALLDGQSRATTARRRSGDELPVEVVASSADGSARGHVLLLIRPIDDRARAEAAERRLDEVLTVVNHDLRTPLTSIVGFAELLLERSFTPEKQSQLLVFIRREGTRLEALLGQLQGPIR